MGQKHSLLNKHKKKNILKISSKIQQEVICPFCLKQFNENYNYIQFNNHLQECGNIYSENKQNSQIYSQNSK